MVIARQSTARTITVGPVLDADGVAVTDCVVGDFKIAKNGGAPAALNGSATLTHRNTGHYSLALTASDLDTVGQAEVVIDDTVNACPVKVLTVVEEAVYDALFAASATGLLPANVTQFGGSNGTFSSGRPEVNTSHWGGTAVASARPLVDVAQISGDSAAADNLEAAADGTGYNLGGGSIVAASVTGAVGSVTAGVTVTTNNDKTGYSLASAPPTAAAIADAVWDETLADHLGAGSTGAALNAAGSSGDPWATSLPGAYGAGTAGKIVGDNLNATVSSRATQTTADAIEADTQDIQGRLPAALVGGRMAADAVAISGSTVAADNVEANIGNLDAAVSSRLATAGYTAPLDAAGVRTAVGLASANLDTQLSTIDTVVDRIEVDTQDLQTQIGVDGAGLTAIGDTRMANLDAAISSRLAAASYTAPLDAAGVRSAVGLTTANLDTQLSTIDDFLDTEIAAILAAVDTETADILADTAALETRLTAALADKLKAHSDGVLPFVTTSGSTTTAVVFSTVNGGSPSSTNDFYNGRVIVFTSGALAGQATSISGYVGSTTTATVVALTGAPASGVTGVIV